MSVSNSLYGRDKMRFNYRNFQEKALMIEARDDYASVQAWALEYYKNLMSNLEQLLKENYGQVSPYTGEYWMGKADLINDILGNTPIDWDKHPRSVESMSLIMERQLSEEPPK